MLILSQNSNLSLIIRTMSDKPKFRDNPQNIWPVSSKVWVEKKKKKKKGRLISCLSQGRGDWGDMTNLRIEGLYWKSGKI